MAEQIPVTEYQDKAVSVYKELSKAPCIFSVSVIDGHTKDVLHWQARWSHRDIPRQTTINYTTTGSLTFEDGKLLSVKNPFTCEFTTEKLMSISTTNLKACLQEIEVKSEKHYFLEVWKKSQKVSSVDLTKENKHGIVHTNAIFGCLNWSKNSDKIVYVAEKKSVKSKSFFEKNDDSCEVGREFIHKEDWGEQLVGCCHPTLFMYDVHTGEVMDLSDYFPDDASISCALWSKNDKALYVLAWKSTPWKLGLLGCRNRFSVLYKLDLETKKLIILTDEKACVFSPVLNRDETCLLYLQAIPFGPHRQCFKLMSIDTTEKGDESSKVIVDIVEYQQDPSCFQGLFVDKIVVKCWLSNGHQFIVSSLHRSHLALICIDINNSEIKILENEGSWQLLYVVNDILFVAFSSPDIPTIFKVGKYDPDKIEWIDVDVPVPKVEGIFWKVLKHIPKKENPDYPGLSYESVLVKPSNDIPIRGLIINPHSGPHSVFVAGYDLFTASFCRLGYAVLRVNFRGSIGFGQSSVYSLPGNVGHQDVCDVHQAAENAAKDLCISPGKVVVQGESHGGDLTLQLVGQHPDFYCAGAAKNPVTNIAMFPGVTDIADWCYCEAGLKFSYNQLSESANLTKMLKCSPIIHAPKVKAPLLFLLGLSDLRVPPYQSYEYIHALKGLGKKVKVLAYPNNNHPIALVDAEADCFVNMANWFAEHLSY